MAYGPNARRYAKTEALKTWVTPELRSRVEKAAEEDGTQVSTWLRDLAEHALTMREINHRLEQHNS